MGPYERHVFVCTGGEFCPEDGSVEVHRILKEGVATLGLKTRVRVNNAGCFNQCGNGPMVVVYPENVWYDHVTPEKTRRILEQHIAGGRPVTEFMRRESRAVTTSTPFKDIVERFEKYHLRALAVVDEFGSLKGMINIEDVLTRLVKGD